MVNVQLLKNKITDKKYNIDDISKKIGIDRSTFYRKLNNNGLTFTIKEVSEISNILKLKRKEIDEIFFN